MMIGLKQVWNRSLQQAAKNSKVYFHYGREFQSSSCKLLSINCDKLNLNNQKSSLWNKNQMNYNSINNNYGIIMNKRYFAEKNPNEPSTTETSSTTTETETVTVEPPTETEATQETTSSVTPAEEAPEEELLPEPEPPKPTYQSKKPIELIAEVPPIEVDDNFAYCDGLYFAPDMTKRTFDKITHPKEGHPPEWIQLSTRKPYTPQTCKYCGLRFVMKWKPTHPFAKYYKGPEWVIPAGSDKPVRNESYLIPAAGTDVAKS